MSLEEVGGWPALLGPLAAGEDMTRAVAEMAMTEILTGEATQAQIAGLLVGLIAKGETVDELAGFVTAMHAAAEPMKVFPDAIDIVGTGGSNHRRRHALNVSTMAAIVASAAGAVVCKHGNRKASSTSGSFDFLEALGVSFDLGPKELETCVDEVGLGFAFAKSYHPAMRFAGPVRAELGIPTAFNLLGPLANPARVTRQVVGVDSPERAESLANVLKETGSVSAWVVSGADGLDELSITGDSVVYTVSEHGIQREEVVPTSMGINTANLDQLVGGTAADNVAIFQRILDGERGPYRDIVLLNAGAGLVVAGQAATLREGIELVAAVVDDGLATAKLAQLIEVTNRLNPPG